MDLDIKIICGLLTFGNEKNGTATTINNRPISKNPPHHIPTHRLSPGSVNEKDCYVEMNTLRCVSRIFTPKAFAFKIHSKLKKKFNKNFVERIESEKHVNFMLK